MNNCVDDTQIVRHFQNSKITIFDYSAVKQFVRAVQQHVMKRLILPRQNC